MTQESEQEQRRRISEMEKDVSGIENLQSSYDETLIKLSNAEIQIEDLKLQLDDALAAEDMLVGLTERNLMLGEVRHLFIHSEFLFFYMWRFLENRGNANHY